MSINKEDYGVKVLYDHQFGVQRIGGISRYFVELVKHIPTADLSLRYSDNIYLHEEYFKKFILYSKKDELAHFLSGFKFSGDKDLLMWYWLHKHRSENEMTSIEYLKKSDFDVFHPTYYDSYFLQYLKNKPYVLTVHDMTHELYIKDQDQITINMKKISICNADRIIVISKNTLNDLLRFFPGLDRKKITVVYHGCPFPATDYVMEKEDYVLFTGGRVPYKNFNSFVYAVSPLLLKYNLRLICAGFPFDDQEKKLFIDLNIADRVINKTFVPEKDFFELYAKALVFIFPSLFEGFGFPVLESFVAGCPAILSNSSSLPEIGGDAAVYFDPLNIDDMRVKMDRVISSPALQRELIQKGKKRAYLFSWEKCAYETMEVYKQLYMK